MEFQPNLNEKVKQLDDTDLEQFSAFKAGNRNDAHSCAARHVLLGEATFESCRAKGVCKLKNIHNLYFMIYYATSWI